MSWATTTDRTLKERCKSVRFAVFDVDGVFTTGQLLLLPDGQEVKQFNTLDGLGIKLLVDAGIECAIITGRSSPQVEKRANSLGIKHLLMGREDKLAALEELWNTTGFTAEETSYMGDDWPDMAAMKAVSVSATVQLAHPLIVEIADWQSTRRGGEGAVRELCELILRYQDKLKSAQLDFGH